MIVTTSSIYKGEAAVSFLFWILLAMDFHVWNSLMFWLMVSTGSSIAMKITPMNPAIKNSISGSANATAVCRLRNQIDFRHVRDADQFRVQPPAFLGDRNHFQSRTEKDSLQSARLSPSRPPCWTRSME